MLTLFAWSEVHGHERAILCLSGHHRGGHEPDRGGHDLVLLFLALNW